MADIRQELKDGVIRYVVSPRIELWLSPDVDFEQPTTPIKGFELKAFVPTTLTAEQAFDLAQGLSIARKALQKCNVTWKGRPFVELLNHHRILSCWNAVPA